MRAGGLAALLLACAGPASAQTMGALSSMTRQPASPVRAPPLAPGEQLLELGGLGYATGPADQVELIVEISVSIDVADPAIGGPRLDAELVRFRRALVAAGVPAEGIRADRELPFGTIPSVIDVTREVPTERPTYPETVRIRAPLARLAAVRDVFTRFTIREIRAPTYSLTDPEPLQRAARMDALARVRARAEIQAAAGGQRVLRVMRVSERGGLDILGSVGADVQVLRGEGRQLNPMAQSRSPNVEIMALISVDFAVAPR